MTRINNNCKEYTDLKKHKTGGSDHKSPKSAHNFIFKTERAGTGPAL